MGTVKGKELGGQRCLEWGHVNGHRGISMKCEGFYHHITIYQKSSTLEEVVNN